MADVHCRCGGKGWRWTGSHRERCTCAQAMTPPPDPIRGRYELVPVERWQAMRDPGKEEAARLSWKGAEQ